MGFENSMNPKISVVTPAYNAEKTIAACIKSIRVQSIDDWEHIIVDDGSTDHTWDILNDLAAGDSRLHIHHQQNAGAASARNHGIRSSSAAYIALLDADDRAVPDRLACQVNFLEENPKVDVLGGAIIDVDGNGKELGISRLPSKHKQLAAQIFKQTPLYTSTVMARRSFFLEMGGFRDYPRVEDIDLWLRSYKRYRFHNLQMPLAYYRRGESPIWEDAFHSARVRFDTIRRDREPWYYLWYVFRLFGAAMLRSIDEV